MNTGGNSGARRPLEHAAQLQKSLLARRCPECDCLEVAAHYEAAEQVAGDFYDILPLGGSTRCIMVGDTCGHQVSSGLVMALVVGFVWGRAEKLSSPAGLIRALNGFLIEHAERVGTLELLTTLFLGMLDTRTLRLRFANAGHPPPIVQKRATTRTELTPLGGILLGVDPSAEWVEHELLFEPGDRLILYTDGILDDRDGRGFGPWPEQLRAMIAGYAASGTAALIRAVSASPKGVKEAGPPRDDRTLVVLTFHGPTGESVPGGTLHHSAESS